MSKALTPMERGTLQAFEAGKQKFNFDGATGKRTAAQHRDELERANDRKRQGGER